ncbi:MAG TPA: hypothetical protein VGL56_16370 [Fimbriimonadaceae bacterium]|jgi:hypothetical protein
METTPDRIIASCKAHWPVYKDDCSGFAKAVATDFGVNLTGLADNIYDEIHGPGWTHLANGVEAKEKADTGWLVLGALKGSQNVPAQTHGHVVVVVTGGLNRNKYPTAYWGRFGGVGKENATVNWAWNPGSRDKVYYAGRAV